MRFHPLLVATGLAVIPGQVHALLQSAGAPPVRQDYPLNCRGGAGLAFDTISPPSDGDKTVTFSVTFAASASAAGSEGQGLQPGTCAWVDRPVNGEEPRRVRVRIGIADSMPRLTVRDSGMYWSFLAHNSDSGYFTGVGYRYWNASWSSLGQGTQAPAAAPPPTKGPRLPFNPRYLPWLVAGWVVISWAPILMLFGVWSGWRRLAGLYPDRNTGRGRSFRCSPVVMGLTIYRGDARLTADETHLHFSMSPLLRPGHPPFSVPWSDVTVSRDQWPWFPLKGKPVIRLTLARHSSRRILVPVSDGERIVAASAGRLQLSQPHLPSSRLARTVELDRR